MSFKEEITKSFGRAVLQTKKNSPHILFVAGIIGVVGSTVLACRATLKLEETVDEIKDDVQTVKGLQERVEKNDVEYSERDYYRDLGYVYGKSAVKLVKLYGPSVFLSGVSIACLTGSHAQMTRRNGALTFTLAAVSKAYDDYRIRVQEEIGEAKELDIHRALSKATIDEDGKKKVVQITDPNGLSLYAVIFDEGNPNFVKSSEINKIFIQAQQNYANHLLRARGHVFLNDVYDSLGFDRTRAGAVVGWVMGGEGDNYIDFGLFEAMSNRFVNNQERNIILDFNVDGVVYDKI